jgi:iron complex outermembrane recepter protein
MNRSSLAAQSAPRLISRAGLARLVAFASALTSALPAVAQEPPPAPPPEESPAPPPAEPAPPPAEPPPAAEAPADGAAVDAAPAAAATGPAEENTTEEAGEVVVTTYRSSLSAALDRKKNSTAQVDSIVAEDMADFPDLNLADSLQRLPGISISRSNGGSEGNQITVRGLGGLYTRVRVNGMEARANVGNSATMNGGRNFDFNLFASELFNSIVVHKTARASLEEGSLGAVVDLNTARAFDYKPGLTLAAGATASYNDLSDTVRPRLTGLISYNDPSGIWGASASVAYTRVRLDVVSTDTVNWQKGRFGSVDGTACPADTTDPTCLAVADAFHPRIPRFGQNELTGDRWGFTAGAQLRPTDKTLVSLDALYAVYPTKDNQRRFFPLIRNNEGSTDLLAYNQVDFPVRYDQGNDSIIAGTLNNAQVRSEHVRLDSVAKFRQLTLNLEHEFTYDFYLKASAGAQRSESGIPHDTTVNYDYINPADTNVADVAGRGYNGFRFDFTDDEAPILAYEGDDINNLDNYQVTELRDRVAKIKGGFDVASLDLHYDPLDQLKLTAGVQYKRSYLQQRQSLRDGAVCGLQFPTPFVCDTDGDGVNDRLGPTADPNLTTRLDFQGDAGPGSTTSWPSPVIDGWVDYFDYYNTPLTRNFGGTNKVIEKNLGVFGQADGEIALGEGEMRLLYDAGLRVVQTTQRSTGFQGENYVTIDRDPYVDVLPSANLAWWINNELVLRGAAARVMARPDLGNLNPGAGVDSFAYIVTFQNPNLDPTKATALDAAIEWYFGEGALAALSVFYKDIETFPITESQRNTFASTGLPRSVILPTSPADASGPGAEGNCPDLATTGCWDVRRVQNGPGATLHGFEIALQAPFSTFYSGLPIVLKDMGFIANYTYVDSEVEYQYLGNTLKERLIGLSNGSFNGTLYYEDPKFSARASVAYRSDYLIGGPGSQGNLWAYQEGETRMDASTSYNINEYLKVSLEGLNLLNTAFSQMVDVDAKRRLMYNKSGRTFLLGARFTY